LESEFLFTRRNARATSKIVALGQASMPFTLSRGRMERLLALRAG
jgi:hypothetical protein